METDILCINYYPKAVPDLEQSKFYQWMEFKDMTEDEDLLSSLCQVPPDIIISFISPNAEKCLKQISQIKKTLVDMEIIAAVSTKHTDLGVRSLRSGASDFIVLPVNARTIDLYINRALERTYLHKHLCFNDTCYQSRFARSEKNYQQLFDEVPCFIHVQDKEYHITDSNRKFKEFFGEHRGEYCFGICKNRDEPCRDCPVERTFQDGQNHAGESEIISSEGVKYTVLNWTAPIRDGNGDICKVLVMLTDITEIRRLEDHLASLGFMIGSISHGIKGLLTGLDGGLYQLTRGFNNNDRKQLQEGIELSSQMTDKIKKMVLDILYYTKSRKMKREPVAITSFSKETVALILPKALKAGILVNCKMEVPKTDDSMEVDAPSLQTALVNILENGIEACMDNTQRTDHVINLNVKADSTKVIFLMQDTGPGMDQVTLNNIFTIFFSSKGNKGTGLGLYITNKVIEQHRGTIKVKSSPGKGTKFLIQLPRRIPEIDRRTKQRLSKD
ncbi:MAG: ATP-binding protein [Pseudomonadota bacterium]